MFYYSAGWQVVEERIDDGWSSGHTTDRVVQHVWGLRYIDDLVLTRMDENADGDYEDKDDFMRYALTDHQFGVIAVINEAATLDRRGAFNGRPLGSDRFIAKLESMLNRRLTVRPRGRPKKRRRALSKE